ncbi:MAG TPA: hypothetical protein VMS64_35250, partial [Candidatus Methylomirabilis sp.]|nr:hypothetical protein [Candidatus Methylomirabilis sp.]
MIIENVWRSLLTGWFAAAVLGVAGSAAAADLPLCHASLPSTRAYGGIVNVTATKSWQPRGGAITFVIETPNSIPNDALITVCFGWKHRDRETDPKAFVESHPTRVVKLEPDGKIITIAATVPDMPPAPPLLWRGTQGALIDRPGVYQGFGTVPVADVRILVYQPSGESVVDVVTMVGITRVTWAVGEALGAIALALVLLSYCSRIRQPQLQGAHPLLRIIASERNYASLSQLQIILWTIVVGASAVYVMGLSGDLIEITGGMLVLLGISGAATIASKWKSCVDDQRALARGGAPPAAPPAATAPASAAPATPAPAVPAPGAPASTPTGTPPPAIPQVNVA